MLKVIAIGDVHAEFSKMWNALKHAGAMDAAGQPSELVVDGLMRVILMGDLVHPKTQAIYEDLTGRSPFNPKDISHLRSAARSQVRELHKLKNFVEMADGNVNVILGNHDDAALRHAFKLGTAGGLINAEFDPSQGGQDLPDDLKEWMSYWSTGLQIRGVHFAHAGPTPGMASFDDFFYGDPDSKTWWYEKPFLVKAAGYRFGVYGHTVMKEGIYTNKEHGLAMVDALDARQYLEMDFLDDDSFEYKVVEY